MKWRCVTDGQTDRRTDTADRGHVREDGLVSGE